MYLHTNLPNLTMVVTVSRLDLRVCRFADSNCGKEFSGRGSKRHREILGCIQEWNVGTQRNETLFPGAGNIYTFLEQVVTQEKGGPQKGGSSFYR